MANAFDKFDSTSGNPFDKFDGKPKKSIYEQQAKEDSGLQNTIAGMGGAVYGTYLGAKQLGAKALDAIAPLDQNLSDVVKGKRPTRNAEVEQQIAEHREAMKGLHTTTGGVVGDVAGNVMLTVPTMFNPAAATVKGAALLGGGFGGLQGTIGDESRIENVAKGAAFGAGGAYAGNKIVGALIGSRGTSATGGSATASSTGGNASASSTVSGVATARGTGGGYNFGNVGDDASAGLTRTQQQLIARNPEFRLTPGQASGSRSLQQLEAKLESQPMTSGRFNEIKAQNQELINSRVAEAIGVRANTVDSTVLDQAHQRVDRIYNMVRSTRDRAVDPDSFLQGLAQVENNSNGLLFTNGKAFSIVDHPLVSQLYSQANNGQMTARQLVDLSSKLGKAARNQMTGGNGDRELGHALYQVKELTDDMISQGLNGRTQRLFDQARGNYRNLMTLESNVGIVNPSTGNVSGANLANTLQRKDKSGFLLGRNQSPMYDAARLAQAFKPVVGDSGTATRSALPSPTDFVLSLPFNVATRAYTSAPVVNLAARGGSVRSQGLLPNLDPEKLKYLPQAGTALGVGGGLLALPQ